MFVLLGRDPMAEQLVLMWAKGAEMRATLRDGSGKLDPAEIPKIEEAKRCAADMANYCRGLGKIPMRWNAAAPVIVRAAPKTEITRTQVEWAATNALPIDAAVIRELARAAGVPG